MPSSPSDILSNIISDNFLSYQLPATSLKHIAAFPIFHILYWLNKVRSLFQHIPHIFYQRKVLSVIFFSTLYPIILWVFLLFCWSYPANQSLWSSSAHSTIMCSSMNSKVILQTLLCYWLLEPMMLMASPCDFPHSPAFQVSLTLLFHLDAGISQHILHFLIHLKLD